MNFQEEKSRLREAITQRITAMREKDRAAESRSICRRIREEIDIVRYDTIICGYIPLKTEVDILQLLKELLAEGYPLFLPRFEAGALTFRRMQDLSNLSKGALNIPEPALNAPSLPLNGNVLFLVPGRAFDRKGGRLGRGNGGYDRWIHSYRTRNPEARFFGVAFECQIVQEVPREEHDALLDIVITARGELW